jgi:3-oxosteroid 1-dehydrogenase
MEEFVPLRAARHEPVARRESARPQRTPDVDTTVDVVVVGGGPGGQATALFCAQRGLDVLLLEKAPELGGTGRKAAFACWAPNNRWLRESGTEDPEDDFMRFAARTARPERYDPESPTFGLSQWESDLQRTIYRSAAEAVELLHDSGALRFQHEKVHGEYWPNLAENRVTAGRALFPEGVNETRSNGGAIAMDSLAAAIEGAGVDVLLGHRVQRLIVHDHRIAGVVATSVDGSTLRVGARVGTVFATGGFTHDQEMVDSFLGHPSFGGGAALTNTGDFVRIATMLGAQLRNMQESWDGPINLVKSLRRDPDMQCTFLRAGDSMICVNYKGQRVLNEKLPYNEFVASMQAWDATACEQPNRVLIQLWDQHTQDYSATPNDFMGSAVLPPDQQDDQVIRGETLDDLVQALTAKLNDLRGHTGNLQLTKDFRVTLGETIARFNAFAVDGIDGDFHRGERGVERTMFGGPVADDPAKSNPVLYPIASTGPYYATLLVAGTLDTKGGPKADSAGHVLDDLDEPIRDLYGVGNCVASGSASAYWAAGGTLGPIFGFALRTAEELAAVAATRLAPAVGAPA